MKMCSGIRRGYLLLLGIIGGTAAWLPVEAVLLLQDRFTTYLLAAIAVGAVFGAVFGALFGTFEGLVLSLWRRIAAGVLLGFLFGVIGGAAGAVIGQWLLFSVSQMLAKSAGAAKAVLIPLARASAWGILGLFIGGADGFRAGSLRKSVAGALGGLLGGFIGGALFEYMAVQVPGTWSRLAGFAVIGLLIGAGYAVIERSMSRGMIIVLNGAQKGREFIINQRSMRIGSAKSNEIPLPQSGSKPVHLKLIVRGKEVYAEPEAELLINDTKSNGQVLKIEDVIRTGNVSLMYRYE